jgi:uncharacterized cupredoxin-like copper-binding protein
MRRAWSLAAILLLVAVACGSGGGVSVELEEFAVHVAPGSVAAGATSVTVRNTGQVRHELVILRTAWPPNRLPVRAGLVLLRRPGIVVVNRTARLDAGKSKMLHIDLRPGPYVLICNVPGHYQSGMRTGFRVT